MADWEFLTQPRPGAAVHRPRPLRHRLHDIAARTGVTERTAYGIVTDLTEAGYAVKHKDRTRPDRYQIQARLPLPETGSRERTEVRGGR